MITRPTLCFCGWSYAQDAFNKWAANFARRISELRGAKS
jgi:hypothetical protein